MDTDNEKKAQGVSLQSSQLQEIFQPSALDSTPVNWALPSYKYFHPDRVALSQMEFIESPLVLGERENAVAEHKEVAFKKVVRRRVTTESTEESISIILPDPISSNANKMDSDFVRKDSVVRKICVFMIAFLLISFGIGVASGIYIIHPQLIVVVGFSCFIFILMTSLKGSD